MTDQEQKKQLQIDAGIPHLPTDLTYQCRIAIAGEGERGWEWQDKPHRLVYDLCRQVEADADRIEALVKERDDLGRKLNTARYGQPDFAWSIHEAAMSDLRAKLAKAVDVIKCILATAYADDHAGYHAALDDANALLAELEKK